MRAVAALVGVVAAPRNRRGVVRIDDAAEAVVLRQPGRALRRIRGRQQPQIGVTAVTRIGLRGTLEAGVVPLVDGDRRRRAAVAEVADHQHVTVRVQTAEAAAAADRVAAQADLLLEEPEALLGIAAVVIAVRAEEQHLALLARIERATGGHVGAVRTRPGLDRPGQRVAGGEAVDQVVLVRQAAGPVLPRPLIGVDRILRATTREDGRIQVPATEARGRNTVHDWAVTAP